VDLAVEAMRRGARDFIQKPWENERLLAILRTQVELHRALQRAERLAAENRLLSVEGRPEFIATAPSMVPVLEAITRFAPSDANVPDHRRAWHRQGNCSRARFMCCPLRASRQLVCG
jgi:DNA-binding NtrC family response regulator